MEASLPLRWREQPYALHNNGKYTGFSPLVEGTLAEGKNPLQEAKSPQVADVQTLSTASALSFPLPVRYSN